MASIVAALACARAAHAQDIATPGSGIAPMENRVGGPPPPLSSEVQRTFPSETQFRLGVSAVPYNAGTFVSPAFVLATPLAGSTGFWLTRWFTAGVQFSVAPVFVVPLPAPPGAAPSMTGTGVVPRYRGGGYATLHFAPFLRSLRVDPALTIAADIGAMGNVIERWQAVYAFFPVRASVNIRPFEANVMIGPYVEFLPYVPVGCTAPSGVNCGLVPFFELEAGVAVTITAPPWPRPRQPPPRPPPVRRLYMREPTVRTREGEPDFRVNESLPMLPPAGSSSVPAAGSSSAPAEGSTQTPR